jgi:hypothetical protein
MATLEELYEGIRRAGAAGDGNAVRILGAELARMEPNPERIQLQGQQQTIQSGPSTDFGVGQRQESPLAAVAGIPGAIAEPFTGEQRKTEASQFFPDWRNNLPEFSLTQGPSAVKAIKVAAATITASPEETAKIVKAQYPDVNVLQDDKGNFFFESGIDKKIYAIPPGFGATDVPRVLAPFLGSMILPGATATSRILGAGLTQTGIEAGQAAVGGEFNAADIPIAAATQGAFEAYAARNAIKQSVGELLGGLLQKERAAMPAELAVPSNISAEMGGALRPTTAIAPMPRNLAAEGVGLLDEEARAARLGQYISPTGERAAAAPAQMRAEGLGVLGYPEGQFVGPTGAPTPGIPANIRAEMGGALTAPPQQFPSPTGAMTAEIPANIRAEMGGALSREAPAAPQFISPTGEATTQMPAAMQREAAGGLFDTFAARNANVLEPQAVAVAPTPVAGAAQAATQVEADTRPTLHRVFEGGQVIRVTGEGVFPAKQPELAYRITGESQIADIIESGVVRAKEGKMRGGRSGETQWSRGHESLGYRATGNDGRFILVTSSDINGLQGGLPASELLQVLKSENGKWVDVTNSVKRSARPQTAAAAPPVAPTPTALAPVAAPLTAGERARAGTLSTEELGELLRKASSNEIGSTKAKEELASLLAENPEKKAAFEAIGVEPLPDVISDNLQVRQAIGLTRSEVGSPAAAEWLNAEAEAIKKVDDLMASIDASKDISAVSENVRLKMVDARKELEKRRNSLYKQAEGGFDGANLVELKNVKSTLDERLRLLNGAVESLHPKEARLYNILKNNPERATYEFLKTEKTHIGDAIRGKQLASSDNYGGMDSRNLGNLNAAFARDQVENVARLGGEEAGRQIQAANLLYAKERNLATRIASIFGKDEAGSVVALMQGAIKDAKSGNIIKIQKLLKSIPQEDAALRREIIATAINDLSLSKTGNNRGNFNFSKFADIWSGVEKNSAILKVISKELGPERMEMLKNLNIVSKEMDLTSKNVHTGKANQILINVLNAESNASKILSTTAGKAAAAGFGAILGGPMGAAAGTAVQNMISKGSKQGVRRVGELFADPAFKSLIREIAQTGEVSTRARNRLNISRAYNRFREYMP